MGRNRCGEDEVRRPAGAQHGAGGTRRRPGGDAVVDDDDRVAVEVVANPVATEAGELGGELGAGEVDRTLELVGSHVGVGDHVVGAHDHVVLAEGTHRQFGVAGHADLAHEDDVERCTETACHLGGDGHTATRQPDDQHRWLQLEPGDPVGQPTPGLTAIGEHANQLRRHCADDQATDSDQAAVPQTPLVRWAAGRNVRSEAVTRSHVAASQPAGSAASTTPSSPRTLAALKGLRLAIVLPFVIVVVDVVLEERTMGMLAVVGTFVLLRLGDFGGPMRARALAYVATTVAGMLIIVVATEASRSRIAAAIVIVVVGFALQAVRVFGGYFTAGAHALTLILLFNATLPESSAPLGDRLAGWVIGGVVATVAAVTMWPAAEQRSIARSIGNALDALADLLDVAVAATPGGTVDHDAVQRDSVQPIVERADETVAEARRRFRTTPARPAGPTERERATVDVLEQLTWIRELVRGLRQRPVPAEYLPLVTASAEVLRRCGQGFIDNEPVRSETHARLSAARDDLGRTLRSRVHAALQPDSPAAGSAVSEVIGASPAWMLSEAALAVGASSEVSLGGPAKTGTSRASVTATLASWRTQLGWHLRPDSVVFRNSLRVAIALGAASTVAMVGDLRHAFWVGLGAFVTVRSNFTTTAATVAETLVGAAAGFLVASAFVTPTGYHWLLWVFLPVGVFLSTYATTAVGLAAGQAATTLYIVILFDLMGAKGWSPARTRLTDVAVGASISLIASVVLWPRGAGGAMRASGGQAVALAGSAFLTRARRLLTGAAPNDTAVAAADDAALAASRRASEALGVLLSERGTPEVEPDLAWSLVTTALAARLAATSVDELAPPDTTVPALARAAARLLDDADATVDRLQHSEHREPADDDAPARRIGVVVDAAREVGDDDAAAVDGIVTLGRLAGTLDRLDLMGSRLHDAEAAAS